MGIKMAAIYIIYCWIQQVGMISRRFWVSYVNKIECWNENLVFCTINHYHIPDSTTYSVIDGNVAFSSALPHWMECCIHLSFASLNGTFHLSAHENIFTIALINIHYFILIFTFKKTVSGMKTIFYGEKALIGPKKLKIKETAKIRPKGKKKEILIPKYFI